MMGWSDFGYTQTFKRLIHKTVTRTPPKPWSDYEQRTIRGSKGLDRDDDRRKDASK